MITTYRPSKKLSKYVLHYFILDWHNSKGQESIRQLCLPTGCSFMGFHLKGRMKVAIDSHLIVTKKHYVNAQTTRPYYMIADEDIYIIVACLKPTALYHLFKTDLKSIVNEGGDISSLFGEKLIELELNFAKTTNITDHIKMLESALIDQVSNYIPQLNFIDIAVDLIIESSGCISVTEITEKIGVSERYFQKKFKQMVGIRPSSYINIIRYNFLFASLRENGSIDCKTITSLFNFYDVPHFSKHFKSLFGKSPSDFDIDDHEFLKISAVENSLWLFPFSKALF